MRLLKWIYEKTHNGQAPYYYNYSLGKIVLKPIIKYLNVVIIPNIPFNSIRVMLYKALGYRIGKNVFIGMKCYLDDLCRDKIIIEDNVTISYGVYFACHGKHQGHNEIRIKNGAYIGMRCMILSPLGGGVTIGRDSIIGAGALVNRDVSDNATAVGVPIHIL